MAQDWWDYFELLSSDVLGAWWRRTPQPIGAEASARELAVRATPWIQRQSLLCAGARLYDIWTPLEHYPFGTGVENGNCHKWGDAIFLNLGLRPCQ